MVIDPVAKGIIAAAIGLVFICAIGATIFLVLSDDDDAELKLSALSKLDNVSACNELTGLCDTYMGSNIYIVTSSGDYPDCEVSYDDCGTDSCVDGVGCLTTPVPPDDLPDYNITTDGCMDSDGGYELTVKGTCRDPVGTVITDSCDYTFFLTESYCSTDSGVCVASPEYDCSQDSKVCSDGRCYKNSCINNNIKVGYTNYASHELLIAPTETMCKQKTGNDSAEWTFSKYKMVCDGGTTVRPSAIFCHGYALSEAERLCKAMDAVWSCDASEKTYSCICPLGADDGSDGGDGGDDGDGDAPSDCSGTVAGNPEEGYTYDCSGDCPVNQITGQPEYCVPYVQDFPDDLNCKCQDDGNGCVNLCMANGFSGGLPTNNGCDEDETPKSIGSLNCCCGA